MRNLIPLVSLLAMVACSSGQTQQAQTTITAVSSDVAAATSIAQGAVNAYPIAKGIAQVAEIADPSLAPAINAAVAFLDPKVAQANALLAAGSTDAATLTALANTITQQVQTLTTTAAPAIKVVPAAAS